MTYECNGQLKAMPWGLEETKRKIKCLDTEGAPTQCSINQ